MMEEYRQPQNPVTSIFSRVLSESTDDTSKNDSHLVDLSGFSNSQNGPGVPELEFTSKSVMRGFIRKIFGIFTVQLVFTMGLVALINFLPETKSYVKSRILKFFAIPLVLAVTISLVLSYRKLAKNFPYNFILLGCFTIAAAICGAAISTLSELQHVLYTTGILLFTCVGVTLYTFQTRFDLRWYGTLLVSIASILITSTFMYFTIQPDNSQVLLLSAGCCVVLSIYLTCFVHGIISGDCCEFSPEDYVLASVSVYTSVILIFLVILLVLLAFTKGEGGCNICGDCNSQCPLYCCDGGRRRQNSEDDTENNTSCCGA